MIVQIALCAETREKRDEAAAAGPTTQNILDMIKNGLESTFSEDNLKVKYKKTHLIMSFLLI